MAEQGQQSRNIVARSLMRTAASRAEAHATSMATQKNKTQSPCYKIPRPAAVVAQTRVARVQTLRYVHRDCAPARVYGEKPGASTTYAEV